MSSSAGAPSPLSPGSGETNHGDDSSSWRAAVQQSHRNIEVREIAKVLAALEPGASASSKLRLAMQFEDAVFKAATSLADYRKRLTKRLKKVQKSYVPPAPQAVTPVHKEAILMQLRATYGPTLTYITEHAATAIMQLRLKHGEEKAMQLKQHTDSVKIWAADLGLLKDKSNYGKPILNMSDDYLEKLKGHLERRTENIRMHVVKLAEPDKFLLETMDKTEQEMTSKASQLLSAYCRKRYEQLQKGRNQDSGAAPVAIPDSNSPEAVDANMIFQQAMQIVQKPVPLPTRNQRNDEQAALIHLNKMRAASTLTLGYMLVPDKHTLPKQILSKTNATVNEGTEFVMAVMKEIRKNSKKETVSLEDAWMKQLVLPSSSQTDTTAPPSLDTGSMASPNAKRPRIATSSSSSSTFHHPPIVRSRVLLRPGRKTPSNLLPALKRKRAHLIRPEPQGHGSHLILHFGTAFTMTIYLVPLLVTMRAYAKKESPNDDGTNQPTAPASSVTSGCASMTSLQHGLSGQGELKVWGTKGNFETLGHVIQERLQDASAHATYILRKCFENAVRVGGWNHHTQANEFEVEIREATALLEFIQLSRTTYISDWQDDDI